MSNPNQVVVSQVSDVTTVELTTRGPQGPTVPDGDKGDVTVSSNGTAFTINNNAVTSAKILDGTIVDADINASAAIALSKLATGALPTAITVTSANISDLSIVDADISSSAAISLSKLATGALPTAITVTSANISDLSIVNADVNGSAAIAGTKINPNFGSQNIVTTGTGSTGALGVTGDITVSGTVDGRDLATDGTKLDGIETGATADQTASEIKTAYESNSDTNAFTDALLSKLNGIESNATADQTKSDIDALGIAASTAATLANARTIAGTSFDGSANIDISYTNLTNKLSVGDGGLTQNNFTDALKTKLDGIETAATADQTAAEIKTLLQSDKLTVNEIADDAVTNAKIADNSVANAQLQDGVINTAKLATNSVSNVKIQDGVVTSAKIADGTIVNSDINASAAIAGTKISPNFGSQNVVTTGTFGSGDITILDASPSLRFTENDANPDYKLIVNNGVFKIVDETNSNAERFVVNTDGHIDVTGNLDIGAGVDVTGNITVTGTVDGVDIATRDTLFGGLTSSSGVLTDGVTATTQSASDNSTKVATTAYTDTAVANLVDSAPGTLNTLNELAAALGDDPNFATTVTNSIATKLPLSGGTMTGNLTITRPVNTNNTLTLGGSGAYSSFLKLLCAGAGGGLIEVSGRSDGNNKLNFKVGSNTIANLNESGDLTLNGTVDGRDLSVDGAKLDGIASNAIANLVEDTSPQLGGDLQSNGNNIDFADNDKAIFGTGSDLQIFHDGTDSVILSGVGSAKLRHRSDQHIFKNNANSENLANFIANGAVELNHDGSKKFETIASGVSITGNLGLGTTSPNFSSFGSNTDGLEINDLGSSNQALKLSTGSNDFYIANNATTNFIFGKNDAPIKISTNGSERLRIESDGDVLIPNDNAKLQIGASQDLQLFHTGVFSNINNATGDLDISSDVTRLKNGNRTENFAAFLNNGQAEFYFDNSKKLETSSDGVVFTGAARFVGTETNFLTGKAQPTLYRTASTSGSYPFNNFGHLIIQSRNDGNATSRDIIFATGTASAKLNRITSDGHLDVFGDNQKIRLGASQDLQIFHDGSNSTISNSTGATLITGSSVGNIAIKPVPTEDSILGVPNGNVQLYFDGSKKLETTSGGIGVIGQVDLTRQNTASEGGEIAFRRANDNTKQWYIDVFGSDNNARLRFHSETGPNGQGRTYAELTHDEFNVLGGTDLNIESDSGKLLLGASADLQLFHDGTNSFITNRNGNLFIKCQEFEEGIIIKRNAAVELYHDNSKKFETTSTGATVTDNFSITDTAGSQRLLMGNRDSAGTDCPKILNSGNGTLKIGIGNSWSGDGGTLTEQLNITKDGNVQIPNDSGKLQLGTSQDLQIYHDGHDSYILDNGAGHLNIKTNGTNISFTKTPHEALADFFVDGACELYFDNSKKLETTSGGTQATGLLRANNIMIDGSSGFFSVPDGRKAIFGTGDDLKIYHDGSNSYIDDTGTGNTFIRGDDTLFIRGASNQDKAKFTTNGSVELYHDNSKKLETTSSGITVTGSVTTQDMNMSNLNGSANEVDNTKGSWSIQEGSDDLFIINRVTGKKYKFNLTEIS